MTGKRTAVAMAIGLASLFCVSITQQPAFAAAGSLDPTFGTGGEVLTDLGTGPGGAAIEPLPSNALLQSNGDIVVSGGFGLVRYLPDGSLDMSFGTGGLADLDGGEGPTGLAILPDGDILWAGVTNGGWTLDAFTPAGALDPTFGDDGTVLTTFPGTDGAEPNAVLVEPDGDILVGGSAGVPGDTRNEPVITVGALALYNPNGTLHTNFGSGGVVVSTASVGNITTLGLDSSGDIFVLPADAEFSPAGQLDSTVTPEAITSSTAGTSSTAEAEAAFLSTGQFLQAEGVSPAKHENDVRVQEFNAGGGVDSAFSSPSSFSFSGTESSSQHSSPGAIAVEPSGQIVVDGSYSDTAGEGSALFGVARLDATGGLDPTFGNDGVLTTKFQNDDAASALLIQPNGDIVAIGYSEDNATGVTDLALARYLG